MKIFVAHSSAFDFRKKLYEPLRASSLNTEHQIFLPQETGEEEVTRDLIKECDFVIGEVSMPSTGMGIELGWANSFGVPILALYEAGGKRSHSVEYVAKEIIAYSDSAEMIQKISDFIAKLK